MKFLLINMKLWQPQKKFLIFARFTFSFKETFLK